MDFSVYWRIGEKYNTIIVLGHYGERVPVATEIVESLSDVLSGIVLVAFGRHDSQRMQVEHLYSDGTPAPVLEVTIPAHANDPGETVMRVDGDGVAQVYMVEKVYGDVLHRIRNLEASTSPWGITPYGYTFHQFQPVTVGHH